MKERDPSIGEANEELHQDLLGIIDAQVSALEAMAVEQKRLRAEVIASTAFAIVSTFTAVAAYVFNNPIALYFGIYLAFGSVWLGKLSRPYFETHIVVIEEGYEEGISDDD